jgi:hypothetical protein
MADEEVKPRAQAPPADVVLKIVDQPYVVGLVVDDGTNVVTVTTDPTVVPPESLEAVRTAASNVGIQLVEEVN